MRLLWEKTVAATTVSFLLLLLLILWLALKSSFAFFLIGSCIAAVVLVILIRVLAVHYLDGQAFISSVGSTLIASVFAIYLLTIVIMINIRIRSSTTFFVCLTADLALASVMISSFPIRRLISRIERDQRSSRLDLDDEDHPELEFSYLRKGGGLPKRFRYEELRAATSNFQTPIGRGGSGSVFKGVLGEGLPVAVKRIEGELNGEKEFRSEITAIVCVQHTNLVRILGYCLVSGGYRYLVYEFIQNGSLDSWIFRGKSSNSRCLTWGMRYSVAIDVAKALAYLHNDCHSRILHLDVKPQNVLLDENFRARVSDFGISRVMERDESRVVTTIRGTRGYLAPEWFTREGISDKSDVYSYGMLLLELVGGHKNAEFVDVEGNSVSQRTWLYFPKMASEKMREGKLMEVVDDRLTKDVDEDEVRRLVYVALWCIQERTELRPSMELVVSMLKGHVAVDMPPETRMFLVDMMMPTDPSDTVSGSSRPQGSMKSISVSVRE